MFPHPYLNLTTPSLLVESFEEGVPLAHYLTHPSPYNSTLANLGILGLLHMLLVDNFLHADLHPGNILVRESVPCRIPLSKSVSHRTFCRHDVHPQLIFLDTGLVTQFEDSQKQNFIDIFVALAHGDGHEAGRLLITAAVAARGGSGGLHERDQGAGGREHGQRRVQPGEHGGGGCEGVGGV